MERERVEVWVMLRAGEEMEAGGRQGEGWCRDHAVVSDVQEIKKKQMKVEIMRTKEVACEVRRVWDEKAASGWRDRHQPMEAKAQATTLKVSQMILFQSEQMQLTPCSTCGLNPLVITLTSSSLSSKVSSSSSMNSSVYPLSLTDGGL